MRALTAVLLLILVCPASAGPADPAASSEYEDMAVDLLRRYLQVDTTNPPGNELKAALFYKEVLDREGIPVVVDEFAPGRANLMATLKGTGARRPLVLANHMDVVPADPARWSVPPFSGVLQSGSIYGRGAEDMKTEGILQLMALIRAGREGGPRSRDIVFLATADEEANFLGALRAISPEGWRDRLKDAEYLITEGGENLLDASGKVLYYGVETGEKGPFWLKLRTSGTPGHGSRPIESSALNRMVRALDRVRRHRTAMKVLPSVQRFFADQAAQVPAGRQAWYRDVTAALRDPEAARQLYEDREVSALLRNTISITVVKAGYKTNVIPGTAEAELDVRLLPGEDPQAFLAEMRSVIDDPSVEIIPPPTFRPPNESPVEGDFFRVVQATLRKHDPGAIVTTKMLTGATECVLYRPLGIACYGFTPLLTTSEELGTVHGDDERVSEATVRASTPIFYEVVRELAR